MTYKSTLTVVLGTTQIASASGLAAGKTRFSLFDTAGVLVETKDVDGLSADFTALATKPVTANAILLDTAGATLGEAVNCTLVDGDVAATTSSTAAATVMITPLASLSGSVATE